jgi:general nucleoside transport system permease protein
MSAALKLLERPSTRMMVFAAIGVLSMSLAAQWADNPDLTSSGTFGTALRVAAPIALAGLAGLFAERSGTVNIGLEGMMVMGTIMAGWWQWQYGPWMALVGGIVGGMMAGLLMSLATTTFGVNHIVAGFAINILTPGIARFMANELFTGVQGGSVSSSPGNPDKVGTISLPLLSDAFEWLEDQGWFILSDVAGLLVALTTDVSWDVAIALALFPLSWYVLWRTPIGLRLRASGERPAAADSLGVSVPLMRHLGLAISGGLAGMGGAVLVLFAGRYQENQVAGRGFLGLATLIFGNWRPFGVLAGALLFGYAQGITLRTNPSELVNALVLAAAIALALTTVWFLVTRDFKAMGVTVVAAAVGFWAYLAVEQPNNQLVFVTPYVVTLIAVSVGAQRLRPPAEEGIPYLKGQR